MMPRIVQPDPKQSIFYSLGYGGNGVMYSAQAGRRMASASAGKASDTGLPIFNSKLPYPNMMELVGVASVRPRPPPGPALPVPWIT